MKKHTLSNSKFAVEYRESDKEIFGRDLTDMMNEPAFYTKSKRGLKQAWESITLCWTEYTEMGDVIRFLESRKIKTHYWCMVD